MKIYISGPMTGYPDFNRKAFMEAEKHLLESGAEVLNPARVELPMDASWVDYMKQDITMLMEADAIYMLEGWERSKGARIELNLACDLAMTVHMQEQ